MDSAVKNALKTLGINVADDHPPKMKIVTKRFHELSMIHHPDRPGGDNLIYQPITEAYRIVGDYIERKYVNFHDDDDEQFARFVFRSFNSSDITENLSSFTIKIDNELSLIWDTVLTMATLLTEK